MGDMKTCQLCGASFDLEQVRCPLCGDIIDRQAMRRHCIHCGKLLMDKEYAKAIDAGGWLTGDLVCGECRSKPCGSAILYGGEAR